MIGRQRFSLQSQNPMAARREQQPDPDGNSLPKARTTQEGHSTLRTVER
jgi:hypothetical protein